MLLSAEIAAQNALVLTTDQIQANSAAGLPASDVVDHGLGGLRPSATPIDEIITIRKLFGEEFDNWRGRVDLLGRQL